MSDRQPRLFDPQPAPWTLDDVTTVSVASVVFSDQPFGPFDYLVPQSLQSVVQPGKRLRVPLGRSNRPLLGYCVEVTHGVKFSAHVQHKLKEILSVVDPVALLTPNMLRLTKWMADTYLCEWGQAIEGVIPAGVRVKAGTREVIMLSVPEGVTAQLPELKLSKKQAEILRIMVAASRPLTQIELAKHAKCTLGPIHELRKRGLLKSEVQRIEQSDHALPPIEPEQRVSLNDAQQHALDAILGSLRNQTHATFLLHGVTGSGKTEVYIRAIEEIISYGRQAIVLVPEISLTPQTRQRFQSRFPHVAVLHSHLSDAERHWHWRRIANGDVQVVVGARSAVFAPTPQLGLIVLDEEHDSSFKQDVTPRYHARDVAQFRASELNIPLVLGSATPSLESWWRAHHGQHRLIELPNRVLNRPLPAVGIIDLRSEFQNRRLRGALSRPLSQAISQVLRDKGQIILLLNRRGFSTSIQCPACGQVVRCPHCDIALTHHRAGEQAICHYCDYQIQAPSSCPSCHSDGINYSGLGTQRLEAEIRSGFPEASVQRMDSDTMRKPGSHEKAFTRFREGETDILLGTQMIAKGLDFPNVMLVGVINADTALHFPDFRAAERTFHLVTQVAGRTGRGERGGRVIVQTFSPDHPAIVAAARHDFVKFAQQELAVRQQYQYPPVSSMIRVVVRGEQQLITVQFAENVAERLRMAASQIDGDVRILGPAPAPIAKLRGQFRFHMLLVSERPDALRDLIRSIRNECKVPNDVQWIADVDPLDML